MDLESVLHRNVGRRSVLKAGAAGLLASQLTLLDQLAWAPRRLTLAASPLSDIQFDIGNFIAPAVTLSDGAGPVLLRFAPVYSILVPARLSRNPTKADQAVLANALNTIEAAFPFSPSGVMITSVSYGLPYFRRLPQTLVQSRMPRLLMDQRRFVLEEAVPSPTDVVSGNGISKERFNVPVAIEQNDVLFHLRSDSLANLAEVVAWVEGSNVLGGRAVASPNFNGLLQFQTVRLQFVQIGLPRKVADAVGFEFASRVNPDSPMWMGFSDQQVDASGPAQICTFAGNSSARFTTARPGDYFDNGSIAHLSLDIEDLFQFYETPRQDPAGVGETFKERLQYMFNSNQLGTRDGLATDGNADQFTNGGGAAYVNNVFQGADAALRGARASAGVFSPTNATLDATFNGEHRIGHNRALQRSSRASDGTPVHVRMDGPGLDGMDVPAFTDFPGGRSFAAGTALPKLQFLVFVPTAEFFRQMRANQAALDLQGQFGVAPEDNGLERFITSTRRQNFLVPPRRHRSFPLLELT